jgi:anti-sigma factor RsiW
MTRIAASCRDIVEIVTEYLDGGLVRAERLAFEQHVMLCPPCRAHLTQMRRTVQAAGGLRDTEVPEGLRADLLAAFRDFSFDEPE